MNGLKQYISETTANVLTDEERTRNPWNRRMWTFSLYVYTFIGVCAVVMYQADQRQKVDEMAVKENRLPKSTLTYPNFHRRPTMYWCANGTRYYNREDYARVCIKT